MREKAKRSGVLFRPHVKTHKSVEIGRLQHGGVPGPITVSTLAEARYFAEHGFEDITYAVPIAPAKLEEVAELTRRIEHFSILIDQAETLRAVETFAERRDVSINVFLKIDCGYHRAGIDPESDESLRLAIATAASARVNLRGLLTHAGHAYQAASTGEIASIAADERRVVTDFAQKLVGHGVRNLVRSIGSTPTLMLAREIADCDEVRPGNYVFFDAFQAGLGSCTLEDVAVSVLSTVIGTYPTQRKAIIDAGSLAMTREGGHGEGKSFGVVCDKALRRMPLQFEAMSQEHGQIYGAMAGQVRVGSQVRVIPNHSCITAAMFDRYYVVEDEKVVAEWKPVRGW